jgi:hypothetical protein
MQVNCEGCAGCCLDWRPLAPTDLDHERRGPYRPLDETYNLAPVTSDEVRAAIDSGEAAALTPRLFRTDDGPSVSVGDIDLAAVGGRPAFLVGLRKVPKPVAPFETEPRWLDTCVYLDPVTLQCRIHDTDRYPETCASYPGSNLELGVESECQRVEQVHGGERLVDDEPPAEADPEFGPGAVGARVFVHPDPDRVTDAVQRLADGAQTAADRTEFLAVAAGSTPGRTAVDTERYERATARMRESESWVDRALAAWEQRADPLADRAEESSGGGGASPPADPALARDCEDSKGAPATTGWPNR